MTARSRRPAQQLSTDWVTFVENLWWNCDVIHRTQPPISVSNEEPFPRNLRLVAVTAMPEPPIKEDRIAGFATDSHRTFGKGAVAGIIDRLTEVATGNNIEIAPPRFRAIRQPVDNFKCQSRRGMDLHVYVDAPAVLMPAKQPGFVELRRTPRRRHD